MTSQQSRRNNTRAQCIRAQTACKIPKFEFYPHYLVEFSLMKKKKIKCSSYYLTRNLSIIYTERLSAIKQVAKEMS